MSRAIRLAAIAVLVAAAASAAQAMEPMQSGQTVSLAADRSARSVGDSLVIVIYENSTAANSVQGSTNRRTRVRAETMGEGPSGSIAAGALNGSFEGSGQTARSGRLVAQVSVVVERLLPNGDLWVSGTQKLQISGENTVITVAGRVRPTDITAQNTVLSTRLADASINYGGTGFINNRGRPGPFDYVLGVLGLL